MRRNGCIFGLSHGADPGQLARLKFLSSFYRFAVSVLKESKEPDYKKHHGLSNWCALTELLPVLGTHRRLLRLVTN